MKFYKNDIIMDPQGSEYIVVRSDTHYYDLKQKSSVLRRRRDWVETYFKLVHVRGPVSRSEALDLSNKILLRAENLRNEAFLNEINEKTDKELDEYFSGRECKKTTKLIPKPGKPIPEHIIQKLTDFVKEQKDIPLEYAEILTKHFWELT